MIGFVLASWLLTQVWAWDEPVGPVPAVSYRVYWTNRPDVWCAENMFVPASSCSSGECRADWGDPQDTTYYSIVSVSAAGVESEWDRRETRVECFR